MAEALTHMAGFNRPAHVKRHLAPAASGLAFGLVRLTHSLFVSNLFGFLNAALPLRYRSSREAAARTFRAAPPWIRAACITFVRPDAKPNSSTVKMRAARRLVPPFFPRSLASSLRQPSSDASRA